LDQIDLAQDAPHRYLAGSSVSTVLIAAG